MQTVGRPARPSRPRGPFFVASLLFGAALLDAGAAGANPSAPVASTSTGALKRISQVALQTMLDATARKLLIPGAVVLLRTPQGDFTATYGTTRIGAMSRPTTDTYFRIASNTKTMTAAVIVQLAQEGKLKFSDPVSNYVAGVPNGDHITMAELLEMRSGLYNYLDAPGIAATADRDMTKVWTPAELLAIAFAHKPNFAPGADYEYCNTNYVLLGLIIEKIEGQDVGRGNAGPIVRAARLAAHRVAPKQCDRTAKTVLPRIHVRQFLRRLHGDAAIFARGQGRGPRGQPFADGLHEPEHHLWLGGRRRSFQRERSRNLDRGVGLRAPLRRAVSTTLDQQHTARGPEEALRATVRVRHHAPALGKELHVLSRRRDSRLQFVHGLRSRQ